MIAAPEPGSTINVIGSAAVPLTLNSSCPGICLVVAPDYHFGTCAGGYRYSLTDSLKRCGQSSRKIIVSGGLVDIVIAINDAPEAVRLATTAAAATTWCWWRWRIYAAAPR